MASPSTSPQSSVAGSESVGVRVVRPGMGGVVARRGLFERLGDSARVTMVSARAGSGKQLSDTAFALLYERAEGWAAGLRLAALSLAGHEDPERFAAEFSGTERTVAEYLLAEVLNRQSADARLPLLRTSVSVFRTRETATGTGRPLCPGDSGACTDTCASRIQRLPPCNGRSLPPRSRGPFRSVSLTRHQQGFTGVRPSRPFRLDEWLKRDSREHE